MSVAYNENTNLLNPFKNQILFQQDSQNDDAEHKVCKSEGRS
jgi:hypothetical protein